jgi:hypothetical protein
VCGIADQDRRRNARQHCGKRPMKAKQPDLSPIVYMPSWRIHARKHLRSELDPVAYK